MSNVDDKAHAAAVMSFINMGFATAAVLSLGLLSTRLLLLPILFGIIGLMMIMFALAIRKPVCS